MIKLNFEELNFITFPNGETKVDGEQIHKLVDTTINSLIEAENLLTLKYENDQDLIRLMFVKKHLDERNIPARLKILYMPYSRMDRVEGESVFTLKYVSQFINSLNFTKVDLFEPHSEVTSALINRSTSRSTCLELLPMVLSEIDFDIEKDYVVFPDTTSNKRYGSVKIPNQLTGIKHRNFETGRIESLELAGNVKEKGFKALLIDDLCSYGGTFLMTAEKLKELGAIEIYLLVGHCENSIFDGKMLKENLIKRVFTTDSILTKEHEKISIVHTEEI